MCTKCRIDNGALVSAALGLATQAFFNADADDEAHGEMTPGSDEEQHLHALSEYNCRLAKFIRERTEYVRLARVGNDEHGRKGLFGGEFPCNKFGDAFTIDVVTGVRRNEKE